MASGGCGGGMGHLVLSDNGAYVVWQARTGRLQSRQGISGCLREDWEKKILLYYDRADRTYL